MGEKEKLLGNLTQELNRGTLVLAVLASLKEARYGYSLIEYLNDAGIKVEQNTLYPLLRRLEKQGLLKSEWDTSESRPRKYYVITPLGEELVEDLNEVWLGLTDVMGTLLDGR